MKACPYSRPLLLLGGGVRFGSRAPTHELIQDTNWSATPPGLGAERKLGPAPGLVARTRAATASLDADGADARLPRDRELEEARQLSILRAPEADPARPGSSSPGVARAAILVVSGALDIVAGHRSRVSALRLRARLVAKRRRRRGQCHLGVRPGRGVAALDGSLQESRVLEGHRTRRHRRRLRARGARELLG